MNNQSFWEDKLIIHNFDYEEITTEVELHQIEPEEVKVKVIPKEIKRIMVYVLPIVIHESYDPLYDETRNSIGYGQKFTTEVIIADQSDLSIALWTNAKEIKNDSIIYIPKDRRWWKVQSSIIKAEGWLLQCMPSNIQPSFED